MVVSLDPGFKVWEAVVQVRSGGKDPEELRPRKVEKENVLGRIVLQFAEGLVFFDSGHHARREEGKTGGVVSLGQKVEDRHIRVDVKRRTGRDLSFDLSQDIGFGGGSCGEMPNEGGSYRGQDGEGGDGIPRPDQPGAPNCDQGGGNRCHKGQVSDIGPWESGENHCRADREQEPNTARESARADEFADPERARQYRNDGWQGDPGDEGGLDDT